MGKPLEILRIDMAGITMTTSPCKEKFPLEVARVHSYKTTATNGEEYLDFAKRINIALEKIKQSDKDIVGVLTHGGPIKYVYREILKLGEVNIADCGFCVLETDSGSFQLLHEHGVNNKSLSF